MGLEKVKDEISCKAEEHRDTVIAEGKEEAATIMKSAKEKISIRRKEMEADLKKVLESIEQTEVAAAELEVKKMLLEEKKLAAEDVFSAAKEKLAEISNDKRKEHVKKLLQKAQNEIDVAVVYCNKNDAKLVEGVETQEADIIGGIIAENSDHSVSIDYSYEALLEGVKEKLIKEVAETLFD